mmetsp:Transcript_103878/g.260526  ORF Transcript_103878/g.260526 Transcript_103878/m.260526 type:complete len:378 (-) Transcript_103878:17-1150(-)
MVPLFKSWVRRAGHRVRDALRVHVRLLERVVSHTARAVVAPIPVWAIAMGFTHQPGIQRCTDSEHVPQAEIQEQVLAPLSLPRNRLRIPLNAVLWPGAIRAGLVVLRECVDCTPREHLNRAMQAVLAIPQVPSCRVVLQHNTQTRREEDCVRIDLHSPIVAPVPTLVDNLVPHCDEDICVPRNLMDLALQAVCHYRRCHSWCNLEGPVAVHGPGLAREDAGAQVLLNLEQLWLVAGWLAQRKAEHGEALQAWALSRSNLRRFHRQRWQGRVRLLRRRDLDCLARRDHRLDGHERRMGWRQRCTRRVLAHILATPRCASLLWILRVDACLTALPATCPLSILHVAALRGFLTASLPPAILAVICTFGQIRRTTRGRGE